MKKSKKIKKLSNSIYFILTFTLLCVFDYYVSNLLYASIKSGVKFATPFMNLTYAKNTGAAFSIMQNSQDLLIILSTISLVAIFIYVFKYISKTPKKFLLVLALLGAGIFGNLFQRVMYGFVRDFFELTFCNFPIFNISDIFVTAGVIGLAIAIIFSRK